MISLSNLVSLFETLQLILYEGKTQISDSKKKNVCFVDSSKTGMLCQEATCCVYGLRLRSALLKLPSVNQVSRTSPQRGPSGPGPEVKAERQLCRNSGLMRRVLCGQQGLSANSSDVFPTWPDLPDWSHK